MQLATTGSTTVQRAKAKAALYKLSRCLLGVAEQHLHDEVRALLPCIPNLVQLLSSQDGDDIREAAANILYKMTFPQSVVQAETKEGILAAPGSLAALGGVLASSSSSTGPNSQLLQATVGLLVNICQIRSACCAVVAAPLLIVLQLVSLIGNAAVADFTQTAAAKCVSNLLRNVDAATRRSVAAVPGICSRLVEGANQRSSGQLSEACLDALSHLR